ncbi:MAG TPA: hypothetical protein VLM18_03845 [Croceibacterium sp.]|nr:hypothetical protein [Croceibacterium sp.]
MFSAVSGVYWYLVAHFLNTIAPMMLNDVDWLGGVLVEAAGMLLLYVLAAHFFFRWLLRREHS